MPMQRPQFSGLKNRLTPDICADLFLKVPRI